MSKLTVKFFAHVRERLSVDELTLEYCENDSVLSVKKRLSEKNALYAEVFGGQLIAALNQTIVSDTAVVKGGDELAFFPPVTGG